MDVELLRRLVECHSTTGDEDEVMAVMKEAFRDCGLHTASLGRYALVARNGKSRGANPAVLICAHADSPGFIVQSIKDGVGNAVELGKPYVEEGTDVPVVAKRGKLKFKGTLRCEESDKFLRCHEAGLCRGDRVCFEGTQLEDGDFLKGPFLDNRLGCFVLCELARSLDWASGVDVALAVTGGEEFTGFGASVLANHYKPDMVFCLDATYVDDDQEIKFGHGPVLTVTDKSVALGQVVVDQFTKLCSELGIDIQAEIYNYSGTDAVAFPRAGLTGLVFPVLMPTKGNHSNEEIVNRHDLQAEIDLMRKLCGNQDALVRLKAISEW